MKVVLEILDQKLESTIFYKHTYHIHFQQEKYLN